MLKSRKKLSTYQSCDVLTCNVASKFFFWNLVASDFGPIDLNLYPINVVDFLFFFFFFFIQRTKSSMKNCSFCVYFYNSNCNRLQQSKRISNDQELIHCSTHIWPKTCTTFHPIAFVTSHMALVTAGNTQVINICYLPQVVLTTYRHIRAQLWGLYL